MQLNQVIFVAIKRALLVDFYKSPFQRITNQCIALLKASALPIFWNREHSSVEIPQTALQAPSGFLEPANTLIRNEIAAVVNICF